MNSFMEILCTMGIEEHNLCLYTYPIKHLNAPLLPYDSLSDNAIFLISTLSILIDSLHI